MRDFVPAAGRYRTVPESRIVEMLFLYGWVFAVRGGGRDAAAREIVETLDRWVAMGLGHGRASSGERLFDSVEVANFFSWAGACRGDPAWGNNIAVQRRQMFELYGKAPLGDAAPSLAELAPKRFAVTFKRTFDLANMPIGAPARGRAERGARGGRVRRRPRERRCVLPCGGAGGPLGL